MRSSRSSSADPLALTVAFPAPPFPIGPPYQVLTLVRVSFGALSPRPLIVPLPRRVHAGSDRFQVVRVDAAAMLTAFSPRARLVLGVAQVVDLIAVRDWPLQVLVRPAVHHLLALTGAWLEVAVSVCGAVGSGPHPASVGLRFRHPAEPGKFYRVHRANYRKEVYMGAVIDITSRLKKKQQPVLARPPQISAASKERFERMMREHEQAAD